MRAPLGAQIPFTRVDENYFRVLRISALITTGIFTLPLIIFGCFYGGVSFPANLWWIATVIPLVLGAISLIFAKRRARAIGYFEGENELIIHRGIMFEHLNVVPYGRMQQVNVSSGPLLGRFDLASVELVTASADSDATIPGLTRAEAERLRDRLTDLGSAQMEGL
ncbi:PH domain-containing protein [Arcanobacterium hippocoleae]|uniref:PH domain-containing protein n=1 Tax=Arcanobacterium hippocoleae TaxID=149017 RepID=UPI003342A2F2